MSSIALVIAPQTFRDEELFETQEELQARDVETTIVSRVPGECTGKLGGKAKATLSISQLRSSDFDAVAFIGGAGCSAYFNDREAERVLGEFLDDRKPVGAICLAPMILAHARVIKGRRVSVTEGSIEELVKHGADYAGPGVIIDGLFITADGPQASREFGNALADALHALPA